MNFRISKKRNQRRYYCDHCKVWIIGDRRDIKNHNGTAMHRKNYERQLEEKHQESRKRRIKEGLVRPGEVDISIDLEKTKKEKKRDERKKKYQENMKKQQERRMQKGDNGLIGEAVSLKELGFKKMGNRKRKVWDIVIDKEKGKAVFLNTLTGEKRDEKPFGLVLDKEDKELWENSQKMDIDYSQMPTLEDLNTKVGKWEEVKQHEDFFRIHADYSHPDLQEENNEEENERKRQEFEKIFEEADGDMAKAVEKILVIQEVDTKNGESGDFIKAKRLQKLAESEVDLDFEQESFNEQYSDKLQEIDKMTQNNKSGFFGRKKRKKGKGKKKKSVSINFGDE